MPLEFEPSFFLLSPASLSLLVLEAEVFPTLVPDAAALTLLPLLLDGVVRAGACEGLAPCDDIVDSDAGDTALLDAVGCYCAVGQLLMDFVPPMYDPRYSLIAPPVRLLGTASVRRLPVSLGA